MVRCIRILANGGCEVVCTARPDAKAAKALRGKINSIPSVNSTTVPFAIGGRTCLTARPVTGTAAVELAAMLTRELEPELYTSLVLCRSSLAYHEWPEAADGNCFVFLQPIPLADRQEIARHTEQFVKPIFTETRTVETEDGFVLTGLGNNRSALELTLADDLAEAGVNLCHVKTLRLPAPSNTVEGLQLAAQDYLAQL